MLWYIYILIVIMIRQLFIVFHCLQTCCTLEVAWLKSHKSKKNKLLNPEPVFYPKSLIFKFLLLNSDYKDWANHFYLGYNGTHPWEKPGQPFDGHIVWGMRGGCTLLGTLIIPFAFTSGMLYLLGSYSLGNERRMYTSWYTHHSFCIYFRYINMI